MDRETKLGIVGACAVVFLLLVAVFCLESVSTAYEAVGTRFGRPTGIVLNAGLHFVNPLDDYTHYSNAETVTEFTDLKVHAEDQQKAEIDVAIRWRLLPGSGLKLRAETGDMYRAIEVHLTPHARTALREAGRGTEQVEDFFKTATVKTYQDTALAQLREVLRPFGFEISAVMVRDVSLPDAITAAIEMKKQREQEIDQQVAVLEIAKLAADQQIAVAQSNLEATRLDAQAVVVAAEAEAEAIQLVKTELTADYIEKMRVEQWDGVYPSTVVGSGTNMSMFIPGSVATR